MEQRIRRRFSNILTSSIAICRRSKEPAESPICIKPDSSTPLLLLPSSVSKSRPRLSDLFSADSDTTRCSSGISDADDRASSSMSHLSPFEYQTFADELQLHSDDTVNTSSSLSSNETEDHTKNGNRVRIKQRRGRGQRRRRRKGLEAAAVAKRSVDPYEDFKRSMVEMIVEKEMFEREELEELLLSFLGLNSPEHHKTIVLVFVDILQILFSNVSR